MDENDLEIHDSSSNQNNDDDIDESSKSSGDGENSGDENLDFYEEDGFIIDDDEIEKNVKEEKKKRKRLRKGPKRKRLELEESDLDLIEENLERNGEYAGLVVPRRKKSEKSKKIQSKSSAKHDDEKALEQLLFPDAEEEDLDDTRLQDIGEDEEDDEFISSDEDSWIVDDEEDEKDGKKKRKKKRSRKGNNITSEQYRTANDLYNYEEYMDMVREDDMFDTEDYERESKDTYQLYLTKGFEPSLLEDRFMTSFDEKIRDTDVPEMLQRRLLNRPQATPEDIQSEAEWIYDKLFSENRYNRQRSVVTKIGNVLQFILVDNFEVPFISTYRREYWLPDLSRKHLWEIYDLDQRYFFLTGRKMNLKQMIENTGNLDLAVKIDFVEEEQDAQDYLRYFTLHHKDSEDTESNIKRPEKRDFYSRAKKHGLTGLIMHFGITPQKVAENLENIFLKNTDQIVKPDPLYIDDTFNYFKELTENYNVKRKYKSEQDKIDSFLNTISSIMAEEIATEPLVLKLLRPLYYSFAFIITEPTELGKSSINEFSPFRAVKRLNKKPISMINEGQYLLIAKAESENLIKVQFGVNEEIYKYDIESKLEQAFLLESLSDVWNDQRKKVINIALKRFLIPDFENYIRRKLKKDSDQYVANQCAEKLEQMLMSGPYKPPEDQHIEGGRVRVMACCVNDRYTECVQLDHHGEVEEKFTVSTYLRYRENDQQLIRSFVEQQKPCVIVVGTDRKSNIFFPSLQSIVEDLPNLRCTFANTDVSNVFKNSKRAQEEFPSYSESVRKAISLGRRLLDPLLEISGMNNDTDLLRFDFHPLKEYVDQEFLLNKLKRCFINVTNAVGVDINTVIRHKWMQPVLTSLCGLGPVKSHYTIQDISNKGFIEVREDLEPILQPNVYKNAAGFVKILHGISSEEEDPVEMLDLTRIHPEHYDLAKKVAKDAVKDVIDKDEDYVEALLRNPQNLEKIDVDYFATQLEEKGLKKRLTLEDIKNELNNPFAECRELYTELTLEEVQELISKDERAFEGDINTVPGAIPFDPFLIEDTDEKEKETVPERATFVKRNITNPYFLNYTSEETKQYLMNKEPLTFIIRPSSDSPNKLTISFSFYGNTILNFEVIEEDKVSDEKLGKILKAGNERFESIDDLIVNYVDRIVFLAEALSKSRYYQELKREDIDSYLLKKKNESPQSIPYCISPSFNKPGYFYLYFLPGRNSIQSIPIGLRQDGLRFMHKSFESSEKIIKYFKTNFHKIVQGR